MVTPRSTETWPPSGCSSLVISRKIVVFPEPLGPTRPTFSPRLIAAEASMKRICLPCCLPIPSSRITKMPCCERGGGPARAAHIASTANALRPAQLDEGLGDGAEQAEERVEGVVARALV